eukprot:Rmarinus@m.8609
MEIVYAYTKTRSQFGRHCDFKDTTTDIKASIEQSEVSPDDGEKWSAIYIEKNPNSTAVYCTPTMSEHEVNTERFVHASIGIMHKEGGWPKEVDASEVENTIRYRKKVEKDQDYTTAILSLGEVVEHTVKQNNSIDIYEEYFAGMTTDHSGEPPSAKTLTVFRDPQAIKRHATALSWYPDGGKKLAIAYSMLSFQRWGSDMSPSSYIWDVNNPNFPEMDIMASSPLCCLEYNPRDAHVLVGGSYNGLIAYWDTRRGSQAIVTSLIENSHRDPVYKLQWLQSKTGTECASISTDGQVMWWDTRRLQEPTDRLLLDPKNDGVVLGGVSLEYSAAGGPTKFMVGTEQGSVLSCNKKAKKADERIGSAYLGHHGPVYALQRHPFQPKYFLTVGDWTARVWNEDLKTPIMTTKYHKSYLTDGCWSPTRPGVFFTTKQDGQLDIWDYFYKQNDPALSLQVSDVSLNCLCVQDQGKHVAVGDIDGSTTLLEICDGLCVVQPNEKTSIVAMFEREMKREKNLEARAKELRNKEKKQPANKQSNRAKVTDDVLKTIEEDFFSLVRSAEGEGPVMTPTKDLEPEGDDEADPDADVDDDDGDDEPAVRPGSRGSRASTAASRR